MGNYYRAGLIAALCSAILLTVSGCGDGRTDSREDRLSLAFVCKDLDHYWFQQEKTGMEWKCRELGVSLQCFDADYDDEACLKLVEEAAKMHDGLIICTTSQELGPKISEVCNKAEIPIVTIDDSMENEDGEMLPFVGMALREVGMIGGSALAELAEEKGFPKESSRIHVVEIDVPEVATFRERLEGYEEALIEKMGIEESVIQVIWSDTGMYEENRMCAEEWFAENPPEPEDYWIVCGANDDCALAVMHTLTDAGVPQSQVIACGLGGYELSTEEFESGNDHYIAVMTQPNAEGEQAVQMLYDYLTKGTPMKETVMLGGTVATCDNYLLYYDSSMVNE